MRATALPLIVLALIIAPGHSAIAQGGRASQTSASTDSTPDPIKIAVARLDLEKYKATIKGLTQFGDRLREPNAIATRSTGSRRSSKATAVPTPNESPTTTNSRHRETPRDAVAPAPGEVAYLGQGRDPRKGAERRAAFARARV